MTRNYTQTRWARAFIGSVLRHRHGIDTDRQYRNAMDALGRIAGRYTETGWPVLAKQVKP